MVVLSLTLERRISPKANGIDAPEDRGPRAGSSGPIPVVDTV